MLNQGTQATKISDLAKPPVRKLVLKGGGARGFAHLGVFEALDHLQLLDQIEEVAGASVGAIGALLISTGWPVSKIKQKLMELDLAKMTYDRYTLSGLYTLYYKSGMYEGMGFYHWFQEIIQEVTGDPKATFEDWHRCKRLNPKMKDLFLEACKIFRGSPRNEEFSYRSHHKDVPICDAIRASMAFPGIFTPWKIKGFYWSDSGLIRNCPVTMFEIAGERNPSVLAVWLDDCETIDYLLHGHDVPYEPDTHMTAGEIFSKQIEAVFTHEGQFLAKGRYRRQVIFCDHLGVDTLDFGACAERKNAMIESGVYSTLRYFIKRYPAYTRAFVEPMVFQAIKVQGFPTSITRFRPPIVNVDGGIQIQTLTLEDDSNGDVATPAASMEKDWVYVPSFQLQRQREHSQLYQGPEADGHGDEQLACKDQPPIRKGWLW